MGRGVEIPSGAVETVYLQGEFCIHDDNFGWDYFVEDIKGILEDRYPSLSSKFRDEQWIERECKVILWNGHTRITVSEYGGCVAICLVPYSHSDQDYPELAEAWCRQISPGFQTCLRKAFPKSALRHVATGSNGIPFYEVIV